LFLPIYLRTRNLTLFPYTTLFRSLAIHQQADHSRSGFELAVAQKLRAPARRELLIGGRDRAFLRAFPTGAGAFPLLVHFALEARSEEHTSELQSRVDLVCRLLLEK